MKTHHILLILCLLLTLAILPAHRVSAQSPVVVALPAAATGTPGNQVTIPIRVPNTVTGLGIIAYDFRLTFNAAVLSLVSVSNADTMSTGWTITPNTSTPGVLQVAAFNTVPLTGNGTLLNLVFNVVGARGTSTALTWTNFVFNEGDPAVQANDGLFAGVPVAVTLPTAATGTTGNQVTIPVQLPATVTDLGILAYDFRLDFDPTVLSFTGANSAGTLSAGWTITSNTSTPGAARVVAFSASPMSGNGTLINLVFNVIGAANRTTALTWNNFTFNTGVPVAQTSNGFFAGAPVAVTLPTSATGAPSSQVTIPVQLPATVTDRGILAYDFRLDFDPTVLSFTGVNSVGTLSTGWTITPNTGTPGAARVVAVNTSPLSGSGTLINLVFNVVGTANLTTALTWNNFTFNSGVPVVQANDGFFAGAPVAVTLPTSATGAVSSQVTIPVQLPATVTDREIIAYDFRLDFDPTVLSFTGANSAGTLSAGWTITPNTGTPGAARVVAFSATPMIGSGTLLNLVFNVVGAANSSTALTWNNFTFNGGVPVAQTSNGLFTVIAWRLGGNVTYRTTATRPIAGVTMSLTGASTAAATTNATGAYSYTIQATGVHTVTPSLTGRVNGISAFDAAFVAQCVAGTRALTDCPIQAADASGNNTLSAFDAAQIAQYAAGLAGANSRVGRWVFNPANRRYPALTSDLLAENYAAYLVGEVSGNWTAPAATAAEATTNEQRAVPLMLSTAANGTVTLGHTGAVSDLLAYQFTLHYDANAGHLVEVAPAAAVSAAAGWELVVNESTPGTVEIVGYGITPLTNAGALVRLHFATVSDQVTMPIPAIVAAQLNETAWFNQPLRYQHFLPLLSGAE